MRQVPVYLILGDGRLARHLQAFFRFEALTYLTWSRKLNTPDELESLALRASHILLAVSDTAVESILNTHPVLRQRKCVHFSGALVTPLAASAHPLMTFTGEEYSLEKYRSIPFVLEKGRGTLEDFLPGLTNKSFQIAAEEKVRYHALCVMSGNFTTLLWEKTFAEFTKLGLSKETLLPYLAQVTENLSNSSPGTTVLTGPLARGDKNTIERHLEALGSDSYADVYRSFVHAFEGGPS